MIRNLFHAIAFVLYANTCFSQHILGSLSDSLKGFNEEAAHQNAISMHCTEKEIPIFIAREKQVYKQQKYHLAVPTIPPANYKPSAVSITGSTNADFELANANASLQVGGAVPGWSVYQSGGANFCNLPTPTTSAISSNNYYIFNTPFYDPATAVPGQTVSSYYNKTSPNQRGGNCYMSLFTNGSGNAKVLRLNKSYIIDTTNCVFKYAYVLSLDIPTHFCCDNQGAKIKITITNTLTNTSTVLNCAQLSVTGGTNCANVTPITFVYNGNSASTDWIPNTIDLTNYIGQQFDIDVSIFECTFGTHGGRIYFDALCTSNTFISPGNIPFGNAVTVKNCTSGSITLSTTPNNGAVSWNSSNITVPIPLTIPNVTNTAFTTSQLGTVVLTTASAGTCAPSSKTITIVNTPCSTVGLTKTDKDIGAIRLYPNPASQELFIETADLLKPITLNIFNIQGQIVMTQLITEDKQKLELRLAKGFYTYSLITPLGVLKQDKLIVD